METTQNPVPLDPSKIISIAVEDEMRKSYLNYAMSMITSRALPDVRDGFKPVHRRVMFGMEELGLQHNKATKKCARLVGDVIGKYHPHGDSAVYDAMVRMTQPFSLRYPMVEGQGNFGSVDGDPPAAMRYTECRMTKLAEEMLADLDKETVDFIPNYDDSMREPTVLPSKLPNLLINGSIGIAVGMATNMAPHNLGEVIDAVTAVIDNPDIDLPELIKIIPGPDFPTGGVILGRSGIYEAYRTGMGKVYLRARAEIEQLPGDRQQIVVTEIPYMVNKSVLLERIAELNRNKIVEGISFIRDESDKTGMRIVIGVKKDDFADVVLNQLYKYSSLQTTFGINNLALVNKRPCQLGLKQIISHFIDHRHNVVTRRTQYDLRRSQERAHILEGLRIAIDNIDEIVTIIKQSPSTEAAKTRLRERFGFSDLQAQAILDMRLGRLTSMERETIEAEYRELMTRIAELNEILASLERRMAIIKAELLDMKERFGDKRRTEIVDDTGDVDIEDMIADEPMVITMSHSGYIKRTPVSTYRAQARGGRGIMGMDSKESDFVVSMITASAHTSLLFVSTTGRCYSLKVYKIPESARQSRGKPIVNLIELQPNESIAAFVPVKDFTANLFVVAVTGKGVINKQPLSAYAAIRKGGLNAINLDEGDSVIECKLTGADDDIMLGTANGQAVRFHESAVRELGRNTRGVRGITLRENDRVVGMIIVKDGEQVLTVTQNGYGKRTMVAEYRKTNRGGSGIINIKCSERNGAVVALKRVSSDFDLLLITKNGIIIRCTIEKISIVGRNTQGVRLINLDKSDAVIDLALCEKDEEVLAMEAPVINEPVIEEKLDEPEIVEELVEDEITDDKKPSDQ